MNTGQINSLLKHVPSYKGAFACNLLPAPRSLPAAYVINTARLSAKDLRSRGVKKGLHWVALVIKKNRHAVYFDSFGLPPLQRDIVNFIQRYCVTVKYSTQQLQGPLTRVCGAYCVDFIDRFAGKGMSHRSYMSRFTQDTHVNDELVVKRVTCLSSARLRSPIMDLRTLLS